MASKLPPKTRRSFIKSAGSAIGAATKEIAIEVMPNLSSTASSVSESAKGIKDTIKQSNLLNRSKYNRESKGLLKQARDAIFKHESDMNELSYESSMLGEEDFTDDIPTENKETFEAGYNTSASINAISKLNSTMAASSSATIHGIKNMTSTLADVQLRSNQALMNEIRNSSVSQASIISNSMEKIAEQIEVTNRYQAAMLEFMNKNISPANQSTMELVPAISDKLDQLVKAIENMGGQSPVKITERRENQMDKILSEGAGINIAGLRGNIKNNFATNFSTISTLLTMIASGGGGGIGGGGIKSMLKGMNIPHMIVKSGIGAFLGKSKDDFGKLDTEIGYMFRNMLYSMGDNARYGNGTRFQQFLGKLFGVEREKLAKINLSTSKKEEVIGWNGIAQKTLVEVIPGLLSSMEAAITKGPHKSYDYRTGQFMSEKEITKRYLAEQQDIIHSTMTSATDKLVESIAKAGIGEKTALRISSDLSKLIRERMDEDSMNGFGQEFKDEFSKILRTANVGEEDTRKTLHETMKGLEKVVSELNQFRQGITDERADYQVYRSIANRSIRKSSITIQSMNSNIPMMFDLLEYIGGKSERSSDAFEDIIRNNIFSQNVLDKSKGFQKWASGLSKFAGNIVENKAYSPSREARKDIAMTRATREANIKKKKNISTLLPGMDPNRMTMDDVSDTDMSRVDRDIVEGYESDNSTSIMKSLAMDIHSKMLVPLYANFFSRNGLIRKFFGDNPNSFFNQLKDKLFGEDGFLTPAKNWLRYKLTGKGYTSKDGTVYKDNSKNSVFGKVKSGYNFAFTNTMKYLLGDEYEEDEFYKNYLSKLSVEAFEERKRKKKERRERLKQEAEAYIVAKNSQPVGNGRYRIRNGRRVIGYGGGQSDPRWADYPLGTFDDGSVATMDLAGCGPTALAAIASSLGGVTSPIDIAQFAKENGYITKGGANAGLFEDGASKLGLRGKRISPSNVNRSLRYGKSIVMAGKSNSRNSLYSKQGHIVSVFPINDKLAKVYDPADGSYKITTIDGLKRGANNAWAYGDTIGFGAKTVPNPDTHVPLSPLPDPPSPTKKPNATVKDLLNNIISLLKDDTHVILKDIEPGLKTTDLPKLIKDSVEQASFKFAESIWTFQKHISSEELERGKWNKIKGWKVWSTSGGVDKYGHQLPPKGFKYRDEFGNKISVKNEKQYKEELKRLKSTYQIERDRVLDPFDFVYTLRNQMNKALPLYETMNSSIGNMTTGTTRQTQILNTMNDNIVRSHINKIRFGEDKFNIAMKFVKSTMERFMSNRVTADKVEQIISKAVETFRNNLEGRNQFSQAEVETLVTEYKNTLDENKGLLTVEENAPTLSNNVEINGQTISIGDGIKLVVNDQIAETIRSTNLQDKADGSVSSMIDIAASELSNERSNTRLKSGQANSIGEILKMAGLNSVTYEDDDIGSESAEDIKRSGLNRKKYKRYKNLMISLLSGEVLNGIDEANRDAEINYLKKTAKADWMKQMDEKILNSLNSASNITEEIETAEEEAFGEPKAIKERFKKSQKSLKDYLSKHSTKLLTGSIGGTILGALNGIHGGLLTTMLLPTGPIGGAVVGLGATLLSTNDRVKNYLFGKKDENDERTGGLINKNVQASFKKALPFLIGGATLGIMKNVLKSAVGFGSGGGVVTNALLGTGPIGAAIIGGSIALLKNNERISRYLFGEKGEDGKYDNGKLSSIANSIKDAYSKNRGYITGGARGAAIGLLSSAVISKMGLIGGALGSVGPIGGALTGLGIGIAANSERFKRFLFGTAQFDEDGNMSGRDKNGFLQRSMESFIESTLVPAKDAIVKNFEGFSVWSFNNIAVPFREGFGPIVDAMKKLNIDLSDRISAGLTKMTTGVEGVLKWGIDMIRHPIRTSIKTVANLGSKAVVMQMKLMGSLVAAPLKLLAFMNNKKRRENEVAWHDSAEYSDDINVRKQAREGRRLKYENYKKEGLLGHAKAYASSNIDRLKSILHPFMRNGSLASYLTMVRYDPELEEKLAKEYGDGNRESGINSFNWMSADSEKRAMKRKFQALRKREASWDEVERMRAIWRKEDKNKEKIWSTDLLRKRQKFLYDKGIIKEGWGDQDAIKELMWNSREWHSKYGTFGDGIVETQAEAKEEAKEVKEARTETSQYQDDIVSRFDILLEYIRGKGVEHGYDSVVHRQESKSKVVMDNYRRQMIRAGVGKKAVDQILSGDFTDEMMMQMSDADWVRYYNKNKLAIDEGGDAVKLFKEFFSGLQGNKYKSQTVGNGRGYKRHRSKNIGFGRGVIGYSGMISSSPSIARMTSPTSDVTGFTDILTDIRGIDRDNINPLSYNDTISSPKGKRKRNKFVSTFAFPALSGLTNFLPVWARGLVNGGLSRSLPKIGIETEFSLLSNINATLKTLASHIMSGGHNSAGNGRGIGYGFAQGDPRWAKMKIGTFQNGEDATMDLAGCGPTALASVASELTGTSFNPAQIGKYAMDHGYISDGGANVDLFGSGAVGLGLRSAKIGSSSIMSRLRKGEKVIISGKSAGYGKGIGYGIKGFTGHEAQYKKLENLFKSNRLAYSDSINSYVWRSGTASFTEDELEIGRDMLNANSMTVKMLDDIRRILNTSSNVNQDEIEKAKREEEKKREKQKREESESVEREEAQELGADDDIDFSGIDWRDSESIIGTLKNKAKYTKDGKIRSRLNPIRLVGGLVGGSAGLLDKFWSGGFLTKALTLGGVALFKKPLSALASGLKSAIPAIVDFGVNTVVPTVIKSAGSIVDMTIRAVPSIVKGAVSGVVGLGEYFGENFGILSGDQTHYTSREVMAYLRENGKMPDVSSYINDDGNLEYLRDEDGNYLKIGKNQFIDSDGTVGKISRGRGFKYNALELGVNSVLDPRVAAISSKVAGGGLRLVSHFGKKVPIAGRVFDLTDNIGKKMMSVKYNKSVASAAFNTIKEKSIKEASNNAIDEASKKLAKTVLSDAAERSGSELTETMINNTAKNWSAKASSATFKQKISAIASNKANGFITKVVNMINSASSKLASVLGGKFKTDKLANYFKNLSQKALRQAPERAVNELIEEGVKAGGKTAARAVAFLATPLFLAMDGLKGYKTAEELFNVPTGEADGKMKAVSVAINMLLGFGFGPLLDVLLVFISSVCGIDAKKEVAMFIYEKIASEEDYQLTEEKQKLMEIELSNYNAAHPGAELNMSEYTDLKAQSKSTWNKIKNIFGKGIKDDFSQYSATKAQIREGNIDYTKTANYNINNVIINDPELSYANMNKKLEEKLGLGVGYGSGGFSQGDPRWAKVPLGKFKNGKVATMDLAGCGPTALTNVANEVTGSSYNPAQIAKFAKSNGYISEGGANAGLFQNGARALGMSSTKIGASAIMNRLRNGEKVIISGKGSSRVSSPVGYGSGIFTPAGHIVSLEGAVGNNVIVNDPQTGMRSLHSLNSLKPEMTHAWAIRRGNIGYGMGKYFNTAIGYGDDLSYYNLSNERKEELDNFKVNFNKMTSEEQYQTILEWYSALYGYGGYPRNPSKMQSYVKYKDDANNGVRSSAYIEDFVFKEWIKDQKNRIRLANGGNHQIIAKLTKAKSNASDMDIFKADPNAYIKNKTAHNQSDVLAPHTSTPKDVKAFLRNGILRDIENERKADEDETKYNGKWYDQISTYLEFSDGFGTNTKTVQDILNLSDPVKGGDPSLLDKSPLYSYMYSKLNSHIKKLNTSQADNFRRMYLNPMTMGIAGFDLEPIYNFIHGSGVAPWANTISIEDLPYGYMNGIPYYYMQDPRWADMKWKKGMVKDTGDDLTSLAMILTAYSANTDGQNLAITPKYILNNWLDSKHSKWYDGNGFTDEFFNSSGFRLNQESFDEHGKPLQIRSTNRVNDVLEAMRNRQLVLLNGVQFSDSPFGGVGNLSDVDKRNIKYRTVVGTFAKDGAFAVADPSKDSGAHLIFDESILKERIPGSMNPIFNKALIFSKSDGSGVAEDVDFSNPIQNTSQWGEILKENASSEFSSIKSVFGGFVKIVSNFISSIFSGKKYQSIFDESFGDVVNTGETTDEEKIAELKSLESDNFVNFTENQTLLDEKTYENLVKNSVKTSMQAISKTTQKVSDAVANRYGLNPIAANGIYKWFDELSEKEKAYALVEWFGGAMPEKLSRVIKEDNSGFTGRISQQLKDYKKGGATKFIEEIIFTKAFADKDATADLLSKYYLDYYRNKEVLDRLSKIKSSALLKNTAFSAMNIGNSLGHGIGNNTARDYFGIRISDILAGKYDISDTDTDHNTPVSLPVGTARMSSSDMIGDYVRKFESGNKPPSFVSSGNGDAGGRSFGTYQFASMGKEVASGNLAGFWNRYYADKWPNVKPGANDAFISAWQTEANRNPEEFHRNEWNFVFNTYYKPFRAKNSSILNPDKHSRSAQESFWSTAVQYGPNSSVIKNALNDVYSQNVGVADLINTIQDYKVANISKNFSSSSAAVQASVRNRHNVGERQALLSIQNLAPLSGMGGENDISSMYSVMSGLSDIVNKYMGNSLGETVDMINDIGDYSFDSVSFETSSDKTSGALVEFCKALVELKAQYVWGTNCERYTSELQNKLCSAHAKDTKHGVSYYTERYRHCHGQIVTDCSGILRKFTGNGSYTAAGLYAKATKKGSISTIPPVPGVLVFRKGKTSGVIDHVGVYIGHNKVIHANGDSRGVEEQNLNSFPWTYWGYCDMINYSANSDISSSGVANAKKVLENQSDNIVEKPIVSTTSKPQLSSASKQHLIPKSYNTKSRGLLNVLKDDPQRTAIGMGNGPLGYLVDKMNGVITQNVGYGVTKDGHITRHRGTDIAAQMNTPIPSPVSGTIVANTSSDKGSDYGNYVVVKDASGKKHLMAHMNTKSMYNIGSHISKGETIGYVGSTGNSTGPHLHYEIRDNGSIVDPMLENIERARRIYGKHDRSKLNILDSSFDMKMNKESSPTGGQNDIMKITDILSNSQNVDEIVNGLAQIISILKTWSGEDVIANSKLLDAVTASNDRGSSMSVTNNTPLTINNIDRSSKKMPNKPASRKDINSRALYEMIARKR